VKGQVFPPVGGFLSSRRLKAGGYPERIFMNSWFISAVTSNNSKTLQAVASLAPSFPFQRNPAGQLDAHELSLPRFLAVERYEPSHPGGQLFSERLVRIPERAENQAYSETF
jgi:hypothetical protein